MGTTIVKVDDSKLIDAISNSIAEYNAKFQGWGVDVFIEDDGNIFISNENSGNQYYPDLKPIAWVFVENYFYDAETDDVTELENRCEEFFKDRLERSAKEDGFEIEWC